MIRIDVKKEELEKFIDSLKNDFEKLQGKEIKRLGFENFKKYFCDDTLSININKRINLDSKGKVVLELKHIYNKISSDNSNFFLKIREFIIEKFTEKIKFCPCCGKSPLIFFERGKDRSNSYQRLFQFDHFFPKNIYHKGIINFYNLIPSCNACNHLKGEDNPLNTISDGGVIFHPYFGNLYFDSGKLERDFSKNADIRLNYISKNSKFFKLGQKYLNSEDTFNTFNFIQDKRTKILEEKMKFKKSSKSDKDLKTYFFKNYAPQNEQEILKYSNGKLKKDLIDNLKL